MHRSDSCRFIVSPLHEYLGSKRDTKNSAKDRVWACKPLLPTRVCRKESPSAFQSTSWKRNDWKRNKIAHKLRLFCKESLNTDRNLTRSFLWCQNTDVGVTFKMSQQEKQGPWQSLSHLLKCGEAGAGLINNCSTVNRAAAVWGIKHKRTMTVCFVTRGIIGIIWVTTRFQVCLRCQRIQVVLSDLHQSV